MIGKNPKLLGITIRPLTGLEKALNWLWKWFMRCASGTLTKEPRETGPWNWIPLDTPNTGILDLEDVAEVTGLVGEIQGWRAFIPILGGWRNYVIVTQNNVSQDGKGMDASCVWHLGWLFPDGTGGVSRLLLDPTKKPGELRVRALRRPRNVQFFGVRPDGTQVRVQVYGYDYYKMGDAKAEGCTLRLL